MNTPAWLGSPPENHFPTTPVLTRAQTLPYNELLWENFERLIVRLVRLEASVSECWIYGERGQKQHGIDILAELKGTPGEFACYQCKQVDNFSANDIKNAVEKFLKGKWASKSRRFVLCSSLSLSDTKQVDEILNQRALLAQQGVIFETWDASEAGKLSELLKSHPELVDDFFLRDWVRIFNGEKAAETLGERLDGKNLAELRTQLKEIYSTLFHRNDQGIRLSTSRVIPLLDRYVTPDVIETREVSTRDAITGENSALSESNQQSGERQQTQSKSSGQRSVQEIRMPLGEWLSRHNRSVLLGEPGYGKSAFLRIVVLQLLNGLDKPLSLPWQSVLPVWISFGGFSSAIQEQHNLSIEDYFEQWLHLHGAEHIRPLFRRAVRHGEILLLVDGLDEGLNTNIAQQAMDRLSTFLSIRPISAIFTCRPRGYTQVRPGAWPLARLAPFDETQIEFFARSWFKHIEQPEYALEDMTGLADFDAEQRKDAFLKAIHANPRIMDLARTPLFCQLLIDVFRFTHHLPEQRSKVYDKVIELLLSDHPAARIQAAGLRTIPNTPRTDDMREMLIRLASQIQNNGGSGVISIAECQKVFCNFLTDDINGPGYSLYEAQHQSRSVIDYAQTGLGLIVERAPNELGFFHLTVQEYLAAKAMLREEEQEQLAWLASVWDQPRWREVVLSWFSIVGAEQGKGTTQRAIDHLKQTATGPFAQLQLLRLRTELAVGDLGLSPREARLTIEEAAGHIETTPYPELSRELARNVALGLRSSTVAAQCLGRIVNWLTSRSEWDRAGLLAELGIWQHTEDLLNTLILALHDECVQCRFGAAESLAKAFAAETIARDRLSELATCWPDTGVRAAALHGLGKGWPQFEGLNLLADDASRSVDVDLALIGIDLRVKVNRHDDNDRDELWAMFSKGSVSYELKNYSRGVMVKGWARDEYIKNQAMHTLLDQHKDSGRLEEEQILCFLAESWPGDSEVGSCLADWFRSHSQTFLIHDQVIWNSLFKGFRGNNDIAAALRSTLEHHKSQYKSIFWGPDSKWAYCVIGDDAAKAEVLEAYTTESSSIHKAWVVATLMEAWPDDSEVKELLSQELLRPPKEIAFLSSWVKKFIPDKTSRRSWLLSAINESDLRSVRDPLLSLLEEFKDDESLKIALSFLAKDIWYYDKVTLKNRLIESFPSIPEVRQWAETVFSEIDSISLSSVAIGYQQDSHFRERLLRVARPAASNVRAEVYRVLRDYSIPKDSVLQLTEEIWAEANGEIRSAGVVARCNLVSQYQELKGPLVKKLCEEMNSLGPVHGMCRRAAFAGLLELGEYAICLDALAKESPSALHWMAEYHKPDNVVVHTLTAHYDKLYEISQSRSQPIKIPWGGIIYNGSAQEALTNKTLRAQTVDFLKTIEPQNRSVRSLELMTELMPKSIELRDTLLDCITGHSFHNLVFEAQRIYAEQFGGDEDAYKELEKSWRIPQEFRSTPGTFPPFLYALAFGWPGSDLLSPYLNLSEFPQGFLIINILAISGLTGNESHALMCINKLLQITIENGRPLPAIYQKCLYDWARTPSAESILRRLLKDQDISGRITAAWLLASIGKLTSEDRDVLLHLFDEIVGDSSKFCPDGINPTHGTVTTLPQALFPLLISEIDNGLATYDK